MVAASLLGPTTLVRAARTPVAVRGVVDLSAWDFARDGVVALDGEWEIHWGVLGQPADVPGRDGAGSDEVAPSSAGGPFVRVPGSWRGQVVGGRELPGEGYATYRLRLRLPAGGGPAPGGAALLALYVPYTRTAYRMVVDGEQVASNGVVGTDRASMRPQYLPMVARFVPRGAVAELVVEVSNFTHREGGLFRSLILGTPQQIDALVQGKLARDLLLTGAILIMALYHLGLWMLRRGERAPALPRTPHVARYTSRLIVERSPFRR